LTDCELCVLPLDRSRGFQWGSSDRPGVWAEHLEQNNPSSWGKLPGTKEASFDPGWHYTWLGVNT